MRPSIKAEGPQPSAGWSRSATPARPRSLDISGGATTPLAGLVVGNQGNANVNIHGSGVLSVAGTQGLIIGQDSTQATSGTVTLSSGMLTVASAITLGGSNGGIGTFSRSGGTLVAGDGLAVAAMR